MLLWSSKVCASHFCIHSRYNRRNRERLGCYNSQGGGPRNQSASHYLAMKQFLWTRLMMRLMMMTQWLDSCTQRLCSATCDSSILQASCWLNLRTASLFSHSNLPAQSTQNSIRLRTRSIDIKDKEAAVRKAFATAPPLNRLISLSLRKEDSPRLPRWRIRPGWKSGAKFLRACSNWVARKAWDSSPWTRLKRRRGPLQLWRRTRSRKKSSVSHRWRKSSSLAAKTVMMLLKTITIRVKRLSYAWKTK